MTIEKKCDFNVARQDDRCIQLLRITHCAEKITQLRTASIDFLPLGLILKQILAIQ